jgi:ankyrin repeat protein
LQTVEDTGFIPEYKEWKKLVDGSTEGVQGGPSASVGWSDSAGKAEAVVQLLKALVTKFPHLKHYKEHLAESYYKTENWDASIAIWTDLVDQNPLDERLLDKLVTAYTSKGDGPMTFRLWRELAKKHPNNPHLAKYAPRLKAEFNEALIDAASDGYVDKVSWLLSKGADFEAKDDKFGQISISRAAKNGHVKVVELLLKAGSDYKSKDKHGWTPISWAAKKGHLKIVKLLLEAGSDYKSKDEHGWTPISLAALNGHVKTVKLLLEAGSDYESKDEHGQTPISWAAWNGHVKTVKFLLEAGADFEAKDKNGRTAIIWAVIWGYVKVVELLLEAGANSNGLAGLAASKGHKGVVELLKTYSIS